MAADDCAVDIAEHKLPLEAPSLELGPRQIYSALPVWQHTTLIRVLDLDGHRGHADAPLTGTLRLVNLRDGPDFAALSYAWGPWSTPRDAIVCNGGTIEITANCRAALRALRRRSRRRTIWVDSICIDQSNEHERAAQILFMEDIFTFARPTYVWLGPGDRNTDAAMDCIRLAARLRVPPVGRPWLVRGTARTPGMDVFLLLLQFLKAWIISLTLVKLLIQEVVARRAKNIDFSPLLASPWLERIWCFQEIVLAANPVIVCGSRSLTWRTFTQGLDCQAERPKSRLSPDMKYWTHRYRRYECPMPAGTRWNAIQIVRDALPQPPRSYNDVRRKRLDNSVDCSVNAYFDKHFRRPLGVLSLLVVIFALLMVLAPTVAFPIYLPLIAQTIEPRDWLVRIFLVLAGGTAGSTFMVFVWVTLPADVRATILARSSSQVPDYDGRMVELLRVLRNRRATDPKNMSFAVHGVLHRLGISPPSPDYRKPLGQVYRELFVTLLASDASLISLLIDSGKPLEGAPSWVPDWSILTGRTWLQPDHIYQATKDFNSYFNVSQSQSRKSPPLRLFENRLDVAGVWRGGTLSLVSGSLPENLPQFASLSRKQRRAWALAFLLKIALSINRFAGILKTHRLDEVEAGSCLRNALLADRIPFGENKCSSTDELFAPFDDWWRAKQKSSLAADASTKPTGSLTGLLEELHRLDRPSLGFVSKCCLRMGNKWGLFFAGPNYVGSGPPTARVGDRLASLSGVAVPMVLRETAPRSRRYRVVGPAFVDRLMPWGWSHDKLKVETTREWVDGGPEGTGGWVDLETRTWVQWPGSQRALHSGLRYERILLV